MAYWHNTHNGISDFRLYNQRLQSHEYHCHGNKSGSIWGCTGGYTSVGLVGGGFWNSLKTGLGFGLASGLTNLLFMGAGRLMGGLFGGGLGLGGLFGGAGLYGLSGNTGYWGLNGGGLLGGLGRDKRVDNGADETKGSGAPKTEIVEKENADQAKLNEIDSRANAVLLTDMRNLPTTREDLTALQNKIAGLLEELSKYTKDDDINTTADDGQIAGIKARLEACKAKVQESIAALPPEEVEPEDDVDGDDPAGEGDAVGKITLNGTERNVADLTLNDLSTIDSTVFQVLDEITKAELLSQVDKLLKDPTDENLDERKALAENENLPSEIRAKAKASFYETGLSNVKAEDFKAEALQKLIAVIDTSDIDDFDNINVTSTQTGDNGQITGFEISSITSGTKVSYARVEVRDGELIFHGAKTEQEYVVQIDAEGNYKLMQYDYHIGHGTPDVSSNS